MIIHQQIRAVIWRRLYIQSIRRHSIATVAELLFVFLCFRELRDTRPPPGKAVWTSPQSTTAEPAAYPGRSPLGFVAVYAPSNERTRLLMERAFPEPKGTYTTYSIFTNGCGAKKKKKEQTNVLNGQALLIISDLFDDGKGRSGTHST